MDILGTWCIRLHLSSVHMICILLWRLVDDVLSYDLKVTVYLCDDYYILLAWPSVPVVFRDSYDAISFDGRTCLYKHDIVTNYKDGDVTNNILQLLPCNHYPSYGCPYLQRP